MALAVDVLLPAGGLAPDEVYATVKDILTKTRRWARFHVNAQYTFGQEPEAASAQSGDVSRWLAGVAIDRAFPLRSVLLTVAVHASQPIQNEKDVEWTTGFGVRYQLDPRWALDVGAGRRMTAEERAWYATFV